MTSVSAHAMASCRLCAVEPTVWELDVPHTTALQEGQWEVLLTLGNGYFATRGSAPERVSDGVHYPGTYVAGIYDGPSVEDGSPSAHENIVNLPNWLPVSLYSPGGDLLDPTASRIEHDHRRLDMQHGVLFREVHATDAAGNESVVQQERLVSLRHPHVAFLRTTVTAVNWTGRLRVESWTDGTVANANVPTDPDPGTRHFAVTTSCSRPDGSTMLVAETTRSRVRVAVATLTRIDGRPASEALDRDGIAGIRSDVEVIGGVPLVIEKRVAVFTSRDHGIAEPSIAAEREITYCLDMAAERRAHAAEWRNSWRRMRLNVGVHGGWRINHEVQRALNAHLFHVVQTLSRHTADADVGVPARGLHGEAYRGRIFWDELFVFPLLNLRMPELTRSLLMYRYRRLPEARRLAERMGGRGALFPWQSGSDGQEETPDALLNPRSGRWIPDNSHLQFHVGLAVAYNVWQYFQVTGDLNFLVSYGAELLVEIARFWSARAEFDAATGRYHLRGMMGPDEFHDGYPGAAGAGIDDNAYVAVMTSWLFSTVLRTHELLGGPEADELWQRLGLRPRELRRWATLSTRLYVPFLPDGCLAQFGGYASLAELDLDMYRARYGDVRRLDLILSAEGDSTNRYKVSKQADVLMLFYLFSSEELSELIRHLGYEFDPARIPTTIEHYLTRTTHGSTLSKVVHAWVLARSDRRASWRLLREALDTDLTAAHATSTREGIHLGAMAATADILQRCFTGLEVRNGTLYLHPQLPEALSRLSCDLRFQDHTLEITVSEHALDVTSRPGPGRPVTLVIDGQAHQLRSGETLHVRRHDQRKFREES